MKYFVAIIMVAMLLGCTQAPGDVIDISPDENSMSSVSSNAVKLDFYVMSQCPYGTQVEDAVAPVLKELGGNVDFNLDYIANDNGDGTFQSLHGQNEVDGNIVQLCAMKYEPDSYMDMIVCQNKDASGIPSNWEECAQGMDVENIRECYEGDEGKELLSQSVMASNSVGAQGSPTIYINDQPYSGGRSENDFMRAICNEFDGDRPQPCADIPEPAKVDMIVITDERCAECDTASLEGQLKGIFPGLVVTKYDYSDEEGKQLFESSGVKLLPAMLFDESVMDGEGYANVQPYLEPAGDYQILRIGADFDPTAEICDNGKDDTGNGQVDCDDETCASAMECREEIEGQLQVFIMSDCPYGREAIKALKEVKDNFGDDMDLEVHYIASETESGFSSLHGTYESDEDMIQLCALKESPDQWFDYLYCRSVEGIKGNDWKTCAEESGVDVDAVQACFDDGTGAELLRQDIKIAQGLGIGASPTWLANNQNEFSGITAEVVKQNFCTYNSGLAGCENTLSGESAVPSGSC